MSDLPYTYTDVNGTRLTVAQGLIGLTVENKGAIHFHLPANAVALARAALAAAGDTGHRVMSGECLGKIRDAGELRGSLSMRERSVDAAMRTFTPGPDNGEQRGAIADAIRALPLLDDGEDTGCARCGGCAIDPEDSHTGSYADPPALEPCRACARPDDEDRLTADIGQLQGDIRRIKDTRCAALYCAHGSGDGHTGPHYADVDGCIRTWTDATKATDAAEDTEHHSHCPARTPRPLDPTLDYECEGADSHLGNHYALRGDVTWDDETDDAAPGGMVCSAPDSVGAGGICGMPVEDEPCREHSLAGRLDDIEVHLGLTNETS